MHLLKIHYQKLFGFLTFIMIIIVVIRVMDSEEAARPKSAASTHRAASNHENAIVIDEPNLGARISQDKKSPANVFLEFFSDLLKEEKCPLCFGQDLCEDISAGFLVLTSDVSQGTQAGSSYYPAELGVGHKLLVKVPPKEKFALLDVGLCANTTPSSGCVGILSSKDSFINRPDLISSKNLEKIYHIMHTSHKEMPLMMCPSVKFLALMEKSFDLDDNHVISQEEKTMLYTTLAVAPDLVVLKFLTKANVNVGFPHYVGSCGRVGVMEGDMTPLKNFLDEPFNIRASLGAQLLTMVDDFMEDDPEWYLFYTDWSFDQISVDKEGELVMTDMTKMAIVDKGLFKDDYDEDEGANRNQEICNSECFQRFTHDAYSPSANLEETCVRVEEMGHMMYAAVCAMILSDMDQHKFKDYFSSKPSTRIIPRTTRGLLHNIPDADKDAVEELLLECVEETAGGGRIQAAEELRDYLSDFLIDEDDDDDEEGEDLDENGEDQEYDDDYDYEDEGETKGEEGWKVIT